MARITKVTKDALDSKQVKRGWGRELWIANSPEYCGKLLIIEAGCRGSQHFHMEKSETMYLQSGSLTIKLVDAELGRVYSVILEPGDSITIPRGQVHQIVNNRDYNRAELFEFSTQHFETDSYRVKKGD